MSWATFADELVGPVKHFIFTTMVSSRKNDLYANCEITQFDLY